MGLLSRWKAKYKLKLKQKYPESINIYQVFKLNNEEYCSKHKFQSLLFFNRLMANERKGKDLQKVAFPKNSFNPFDDSCSKLTSQEQTLMDTSQSDLINTLLKYDVVSFDIFDTCILRPFDKPTDLFSMLETELNIPNFKDMRIQAELEARAHTKKSNGEINIFDIYDRLSNKCPLSTQDAMHEIELEKKMCFANPYMLQLFKRLKEKQKTIIAISDMYLPKNTILEILEKNGYTGFDNILVSNEYECTKSNGKLFKVAKKIYKHKKIVHIGDNYSADVQGAKKAKINAFCYKPNNDKEFL